MNNVYVLYRSINGNLNVGMPMVGRAATYDQSSEGSKGESWHDRPLLITIWLYIECLSDGFI